MRESTHWANKKGDNRMFKKFGDLFKLLYRDKNNESRYAIETTEDMRNYLKKELNQDNTYMMSFQKSIQ